MNQIQLSQNVRVSDPCYTDDVWCKTQLKNVLPGSYICDVSHNDTSGWGNRISGITAIHEDYVSRPIEWQFHSDIGVDSGQAGIFCESSYRNDEVATGITTPDVDFEMPDGGEGEAWYTKMCKFTLSEDSYGAYDTGMVSSSGIGDGSYPLYVAYDKNDNIIAMKLDYLLDDEDEDGDICGVCGGDLERDGTCEYCEQEEAEVEEEEESNQN
jgi:Protein of unknown function (DUF4241)